MNIVFQSIFPYRCPVNKLQLGNHSHSIGAHPVFLHHSFPVWLHVSQISSKNIKLFQSAIYSIMLCPCIWFHFSFFTGDSHPRKLQIIISFVASICFYSFLFMQLYGQPIFEYGGIISAPLKGPFIQTIQLVFKQTPASYFTAGPFILWEYIFTETSQGSNTG